MGQYHITVNLDKREYIHPHKIGLGLKLWEQCGFGGSTGDILFLLLACSNGRGGGDIDTDYSELVGRWAGDRIAVIGDYSKEDDIPGINAKEIYRLCHDPEDMDKEELAKLAGKTFFTDISDQLVPFINEQFETELDLAATGWRRR